MRLAHQAVILKDLANMFPLYRVPFQLDDVLYSINLKEEVDAAALNEHFLLFPADGLSREEHIRIFE